MVFYNTPYFPCNVFVEKSKPGGLTVILDLVFDEGRHLDTVALQVDVQDFICIEFLEGPIIFKALWWVLFSLS